MGFYLSPSVNIIEEDRSNTIPAVATSITGMVGRFNWGACNERVLVTQEASLQELFDLPDNNTYEDWYTAFNYLQYGNQLYIVRAVNETTAKNAGIKFMSDQAVDTTPVAYSEKILNKSEADDFVASFSTDEKWAVLAKYPSTTIGANLKVAIANHIDFNSHTFTHEVGTPYVVGEIITGTTSAATGIVTEIIDTTHMAVKVTSGTFLDTEQTTGSESGAATLSAIQDPAEVTPGVPFTEYFEYEPETNQVAVVVLLNDEVVETFLVSNTTTDKDFEGNNIYVENWINRRSQYIYVFDDKTNTDKIDSKEATALVGGVADAPSSGEVILGYDLFANAEEFDINLILDGANNNATVQQYIIDDICLKRLDCIAILNVPKDQVVGASSQSVAVTNMVQWRKNTLIRSTSYAALYGNYKYQYDKHNDVYRWVPLSGDMAGIFALTDRTRDPWFAPAGYIRGLMKNVTKFAINPTKGQRDILYKANINPTMIDSNDGPVVLGQKTTQSAPSAFDRISIRRLFLVLEKAISTSSRYYLFEKNNSFTRRRFVGMVTPFLRDIQGREGIDDFRVICNESNNSGEVRDRNEFHADIHIKATRDSEFIVLTFVNHKSTVDFNEILPGA